MKFSTAICTFVQSQIISGINTRHHIFSPGLHLYSKQLQCNEFSSTTYCLNYVIITLKLVV